MDQHLAVTSKLYGHVAIDAQHGAHATIDTTAINKFLSQLVLLSANSQRDHKRHRSEDSQTRE